MAVSKTTFDQRMKRINSGKTTSWTVPGQGLATPADQRRFYQKAGIKVRARSTQKRRNPLAVPVALLTGAASVIAARWIEFTYTDRAVAFAADRGLDAASMLSVVPTALVLAVVICAVAMLILRLRTRGVMAVLLIGFVVTILFEPELVRLAPGFYAMFYPQSWVSDMVAQATLLT